MIDIRFRKIHEHAKTPTQATSGSAGYDLHAVEDVEVPPGGIRVVPTGLQLVTTPIMVEMQIRSRSGMACKGVIVLNAPGTVDPDYRGEIRVILMNHGKDTYVVHTGDRIAQAVFSVFSRAKFIEIPPDAPDTTFSERGAGGFGSTGT